jgi:glycosyltransferase involved in cell wall biosynthesis
MTRERSGPPAKVVFWAGSFEQAGTQRFLVELLGRLDRRAYEPIVFSAVRRGELLPVIESLGVPVLEFGTGPRAASPATARGLAGAAAYLRRERVAILNCMLGIITLFGPFVGRSAGVPVVINHQRNAAYWIRGGARERVYGFVNRRLVDAVAVNSKAARDELTLRFGVPASKIVDVGAGVDVERFASAPRDARLAAELGVAGHPVVGIVAKLSPVKGHEWFLDAAARIARERDDARFLVVGDGPRRSELEGMARALGLADRVVFAGARDDVPALLRLMDVFVLSSVSEGSPNVVMEAMAAGVPVVATDVGGVSDAVGGPSSAVLVPPRDADALARGVIGLLSDAPAARAMGSAGLRTVRERHDVGAVVRRVERMFEALLDERARNGRAA